MRYAYARSVDAPYDVQRNTGSKNAVAKSTKGVRGYQAT